MDKPLEIEVWVNARYIEDFRDLINTYFTQDMVNILDERPAVKLAEATPDGVMVKLEAADGVMLWTCGREWEIVLQDMMKNRP